MKKNGRLNRADIYGEGLSVRMVRACHSRCRTALDKAVQDGLIRTNPAADCKLPAQTVNEMHVLTREEMQRFLIQAKEEGYFELFLLELATGLRRQKLTEVSASVSRGARAVQTARDCPPKRLIRTQGPPLSPARARSAGRGRAVRRKSTTISGRADILQSGTTAKTPPQHLCPH